ncbi:MAG TPA: nucleotidyltransferase family protein [Candidatus Micrarchaeota archaeon]|nr:nucleotidyltransferase family protein [Candidatus Micrarchaeota archaeon]
MTRAFVLCGGKGTRLRPYTYNIPKPMLPLGSKPLLEFVIDNLKANGITDIVITVGYLKEQIINYFGDGSSFGVKITYSEETEELNTAGSIFPKKSLVKGTFVVVMGDHLTCVNLKRMIEAHKKGGNIATIGLKRQGVPLEYGVAQVESGCVKEFQEKPILSNMINAGVYVFEPEIFDYIKPKTDFAKDVFPAVMKSGRKITAHVFDEFWMDIGRMADYEKISEFISIIEMVNGFKPAKE